MTHGIGPAARQDPIRTVDLEGYILTETVRPSSLKLPSHFHSHTNIAFALEGFFRKTIGKTYLVTIELLRIEDFEMERLKDSLQRRSAGS